MAENTDFETALQRLETTLEALVAEGVSPETVRDAALMLGLGEIAGIETAKPMRAILQISAPGQKPDRSRALHHMYHAFSTMLVARDYPLSEVATAALSWGHAGAVNSVGPAITAETLRMLADSPRTEGMN